MAQNKLSDLSVSHYSCYIQPVQVISREFEKGPKESYLYARIKG